MGLFNLVRYRRDCRGVQEQSVASSRGYEAHNARDIYHANSGQMVSGRSKRVNDTNEDQNTRRRTNKGTLKAEKEGRVARIGYTYDERNKLHRIQIKYTHVRSLFTFSIDFALPFSFAVRRLCASSKMRVSSSAFFLRSSGYCLRSLSSAKRISRSFVIGIVSSEFLRIGDWNSRIEL